MIMSGEILNYTLTLTALGPLFVGSGTKLDKCEYVFDEDNNKVSVMDPQKMFTGLSERDLLDTFTDQIMRFGVRFDLKYFFEKNKINDEDYMQWVKYGLDVPPGSSIRNQISTIIKDPYGPYVPGSSIKGAVRNAILNSVLLNSDKYGDIADKAETESFNYIGSYLSSESNDLDVRTFHTLNRLRNYKDQKDDHQKIKNAVNSIFSGLRISDSKPIELEQLTLCRKIDIYPTGADNTDNKISLYRECFKPGTVIECSVEIDTAIFRYDAQAICKCIQEMYNMQRERFLSKFPAAFPTVDSNKETLLYLGGGSGFVSKTAVYSLYDNENRRINAAAKILDNVAPKGRHRYNARRYRVAPHMRKCTLYDKQRYDFGLCKVNFELKK